MFAGKRCGQPLEAMGVEERGVGVAGQECRVPYNVDQQVAIGAHSVQAGAGECVTKHPGRAGSRWRARNDFGQHWVIVHRHHRTVDDSGIQPDTGPV